MEVLNKIAQLKAELDSLRPLDKDREAAIMQKLRLDWNYHSNHLEGNSLTFGETKALILFGITAAGKPLKDHFEMTGHDEAVKWVEDIVKEGRPLTENFIRELHELLLKEPSRKRTKTPDGLPGTRVINIGVYKTVPNHVETVTGEIFRFATPEETPSMMHDLIEWYRAKESAPETHPLLMAAEFHYQFIRIHPFDDGNGRTARILMNFILMKHGYPPVVVKTEDKANYIAALQQSDAGIITPFIDYIGQNLAHSLEIMLRGARGESIDEADDVDKEIALIKHKLKGLSKDFEKIKSPESVSDVFRTSIKPLLVRFVLDCSKFDDLYQNSSYNYQVNGVGSGQGYKGILDTGMIENLVIISIQNLETIRITYNYLKFNSLGLDFFNHSSALEVRFDKNYYSVFSMNDALITNKPYHQSLNEDEILAVVKVETKAHTDFINQQIEKAQQKNE